MKIWYDVSGIYNWEGHFTGIQRVVYNLGKELHESDQDAHFFLYRHGDFHEVGFQQLEDRLREARERAAAATGHTAAGHGISVGVLRHKGMVGLKNMVRNTPLDPPLRAVYGNLRRVYHVARRRNLRPTMNQLFKPGDTVVVVDGNWQFSGFVSALRARKNKADYRLVHFVHDLIAVRNPALVNKGADKIIGGYFKDIFPLADTIITISESTKRDVEWFIKDKHIHTKAGIETLILGDNALSAVRSVTAPARKVPSPFILAVSTIEVRKNYLALYYAYKLAAQQGVELPHLVIVGRKGWMAEETYSLLTQDTEIKGKITVLERTSDAELAWLYQHCQFTVFPSLYEGWGLPIAESLAHGKACISSDASSMPEVGGSLVSYVSPYDPGAWLRHIHELMVNEPMRRAQEASIKLGYNARSWNDAYTDMAAIIRNVKWKGGER